MLPEGWSVERLGNVVTIGSGQVDPREEPYSSMLHVGAEDIESGTGRLLQPQTCSELGLISGKYEFDEHAVIYSKIRPHLNKVCFPGARGVCSADAYPLWPKPNVLLPKYLKYVLLSPDFVKYAVSCSMRTGMPKINREDLLASLIQLPPKEEQREIAEVLEHWDAAITVAGKLLANAHHIRQTTGRALLSGRERLVNSGTWSRKKLAELISESRIPGSSGDIARKLTVKLYGKGVVAKNERRNGSEATAYYRRRAGQLIYSKLDFLNGAFGLIPDHLDGFESTVDLPAFDFLGDVDRRWLLYYISREEFYQGHLGLANGGRKARRVHPADFLQVSIDYPPVAEQQAIADAMDVASEDVRKWKAMLDILKAEKRALSADLLTGKRRVRVPDTTEEAQEPA